MTYVFDITSFNRFIDAFLAQYIGTEAYSNNYIEILEGVTEGILSYNTDYNFHYYIKLIMEYGIEEELANVLINRLMTDIHRSLNFLSRLEHDEYQVKIITKDTMFITHRIKNYLNPEDKEFYEQLTYD